MDASPLNKLPGELRIAIYEFALTQRENVTINILTGTPKLVVPLPVNRLILTGTPKIVVPSHANYLFGLLATCKQIRDESSAIFYEVNKFTLVSNYAGERHHGDLWQRGLESWLDQIGDRNRASLAYVEIDIGSSFMYDYYPTSESVWRGLSRMLPLFARHTQVVMRTEIWWAWRSSGQQFSISIPLTDAEAAETAVERALDDARSELERWFQGTSFGPREAGYRRVELETCGQELRSFVSLMRVTTIPTIGQTDG